MTRSKSSVKYQNHLNENFETLSSLQKPIHLTFSRQSIVNIESSLSEIQMILKPGENLIIDVLPYSKPDGFLKKLFNSLSLTFLKSDVLQSFEHETEVSLSLKKHGFQILELKQLMGLGHFVAKKIDKISKQQAHFLSHAFSRNLGWVTASEAQTLSEKRIAIAGLGGVGGNHLITLARLGITKFHIADFDTFEIQNFNRQYGADISTISRKKIDVMREKLLLINPHAELKIFERGIHPDNIDEFLKDVDLFVDGFDVFEIDIRRMVFQRSQELGIAAISVAPIGMGAASLTFLPGKMSFEKYFGFSNDPNKKLENLCRFLLGMSPSLMHLPTIVDRSYANIREHRAPSTPMGCQLAAGVLGTQALKILLRRKDLIVAPHGTHFDAYLAKLKRTWMPFGSNNWLFNLKLKLFLRFVSKIPSLAPPPERAKRFVAPESRIISGQIANRDFTILDLSLSGFCIQTDGDLNPDEIFDLKIHTSHFRNKTFKVKKIWQNQKRCGLQIIETSPSWPDDINGFFQNENTRQESESLLQ